MLKKCYIFQVCHCRYKLTEPVKTYRCYRGLAIIYGNLFGAITFHLLQYIFNSEYLANISQHDIFWLTSSLNIPGIPVNL
jgi:hypothetical protein